MFFLWSLLILFSLSYGDRVHYQRVLKRRHRRLDLSASEVTTVPAPIWLIASKSGSKNSYEQVDLTPKAGQTPNKTNGIESYYRRWKSDKLESGYDPHIRPHFGEKPDRVNVSIYIISFRGVSEVTMDFSMEIYLRELWFDPRLQFNQTQVGREKIFLDDIDKDLIWRPDTSFLNAVYSRDPKPNRLTHKQSTIIHSNGTIFSTKRVSVTAECALDLRLYPFDEQTCKLQISSFGSFVDDIMYKWHKKKAIETNGEVQTPDFKIKYWRTRSLNLSYMAGIYNTAEFCFVLKRSAGYCIIQLIFPASVVVAASWISLWLAEEMQFSDILTVMLSILFLSYSYNMVMPKVSYVKAMDVYLVACLVFIFLSLIKMALVKYMLSRAKRSDNKVDPIVEMSSPTVDKSSVELAKSSSNGQIVALPEHNLEAPAPTNLSLRKKEKNTKAWRFMQGFHLSSQLVLPLAFLAFLIFFFAIYPFTIETEGCY